MKSSPASSACLATARQSGQLADQRSGTFVAERPDEQLAPNRPILSALPLYMAMRFFMDATGASTAFSVCNSCGDITALLGRQSFQGRGARALQFVPSPARGEGKIASAELFARERRQQPPVARNRLIDAERLEGDEEARVRIGD